MKSRRTVPKSFKSIDEASDFWGSHDSARFSRYMKPVKIMVDLKGEEYWLPIGEKLFRKLRAVAVRRKTVPEKLIHRWISERLTAEASR